MLVELVVENFYSFRDEETLSLMGTRIAEHPGTVLETDIFPVNKVSALYGANASGKSNLLRAMALIREGLFVKKGQEQRWLQKIKPFHLDAASEQQETLLETSFLIEEQLYRYGFFVNRTEITEEYLFLEKNGNDPEVIFHRTKDGIESPWCADEILPQRLMLADCIGNHPEMMKWFKDMRILMRSLDASFSISMAKLHLRKYKHNLLTLIQVADPSIRDIEIREVPHDDGPSSDEFFVIKERKRLDGEFEPYSEGFVFQDVESAGTVKLLALAGPIIEALENGSLLMIDEMDQSFHTLMTRYVLELFRGEFNTKGAQLVFSTHDISNLRSELFRRDQIWFVEKRKEGNSALVSLVEFKFDERERKNSFEFYQNYLNGKYGAVPFLPPADWWVNDGEEA
ncbi:AAA family ATPase [Jeotgalibaca sp. A122]|uniref:AAA family ATPase n=1 Tax=Jeotgalibaca sp. A122 TaxID=3457322 RepID=UPI003FCFE5C7